MKSVFTCCEGVNSAWVPSACLRVWCHYDIVVFTTLDVG